MVLSNSTAKEQVRRDRRCGVLRGSGMVQAGVSTHERQFLITRRSAYYEKGET